MWPTHALVCADSQVGPFRRTSAPHDHELFTRRWILRRNAQNSVGNVHGVRTPQRKRLYHIRAFYATHELKPLKRMKPLYPKAKALGLYGLFL